MADAIQAPAGAEGPTSHTQNQDQPTIYQLMALVMRDVRNLGKDGFNDHQKYRFRGVDGAIGALAQPLRDHGVFMTPEVLDSETEVRGKMNAIRMRVAFHFYGPAGDKVTAITMGEASDTADKASNKAMSAALKYALIHTFMIPVDADSLDDGDRDHPVGQRSPADGYLGRLRKPAVWNNPAALAAMHAEAKADGLLEATVQGPDGETTLGALIVARGTQLKAEAAEREARRAEEAPKAAAQVAAEHGVTVVDPDCVVPDSAKTGEPTAGDPVADALLDKLMGQVFEHRHDRDVLTQVRGNAEAKGLLNREVQGPGRQWMPFHELLDRLMEAAQRGEHERNAA